MSGFMISRFDNLNSWAVVALSTTPALVVPTTTIAASAEIMGVSFTNNDAAINVYLGPGSDVSSTKFEKKLAPGEYWEQLLGAGLANKYYAVAASGTPNLSVVVKS